ncbi:MAG TPA: CBS domain-containing protein [Candidatus Nanoarchaeia archaeon]|nr:CBS domain-containing protein [Candidatus Nanoarchaeia archaeon]
MALEISDIKKVRKQLELTQKQLADRARVSQSLIAKVEAGQLDPTYSNAQKIFEALDELRDRQEAKASDIMNSKIISVTPSENIKDAIKMMKKFNISQMPVIEDHKSIGLVSESSILEALLHGKAAKVRDVMSEAPPVISGKTSLAVITELLKYFPLVLVSDAGKLTGLVTKADLLAKLYA